MCSHFGSRFGCLSGILALRGLSRPQSAVSSCGVTSGHAMQGGEPQAQQQVGACWIASYPDGALRLGARGWRRFRQRLPVVPWLQNRLVALGGPNFDSQHLRELGGGHRWSRGGASGVTETVPVFGLARILPGKHQPSLPGSSRLLCAEPTHPCGSWAFFLPWGVRPYLGFR